MSPFGIFIILLSITIGLDGKLRKRQPPHCTQITKTTDYVSKFKLEYPMAYIPAGQHEAYQRMYCVNPPTVRAAVSIVCDWAAPPQVQFTLGDVYMHVVRQDPTGRFLGNAIISTYQFCSHNVTADPQSRLNVTSIDQ